MKHIDLDSLTHVEINAACVLVLSALGALIGGLTGDTVKGATYGMTAGIGAGVGASLAREFDGLQFHGHWCWWDILFDCIGLICAVGIVLLCK